MLQRIRQALQEKSFVKFGGPGSEVEVDETFIGGQARNMHKSKRLKLKDQANFGKAIVMGVLERGGKVATRVIADRKSEALKAVVDDMIDDGSLVYTDEHHAYQSEKCVPMILSGRGFNEVPN